MTMENLKISFGELNEEAGIIKGAVALVIKIIYYKGRKMEFKNCI